MSEHNGQLLAKTMKEQRVKLNLTNAYAQIAGLRGRMEKPILLKLDTSSAEGKINALKKMDEIFGLDLLDKEELDVPKEVLTLIEQREKARKSMDWKKSDELKVELDTKLTPELEAEGYSREISRQIQAFRKQLGLNKNQKVKTIIITDDDFKKILEKFFERVTYAKTRYLTITT